MPKNFYYFIDYLFSFFNDETCFEDKEEYTDPLHGLVVETRFDPYHDVTVYEDGYESGFYIGD